MPDDIKRLNYFTGEFLEEGDFNLEQAYHLRLQRDHERLLHTAGVAEGLDIPPPLSGAGSIVVNAGTAYDGLGRRIILVADKTIDLSNDTNYPVPSTIYVTIRYFESKTDEETSTGTSGETRWTEAPIVEAKLTAPLGNDPAYPLLLGVVTKSGTGLTVDSSTRPNAGTKGGDLNVKSLTLSHDAVAQGSWPKLQLGPTGMSTFNGGLTLSGATGLTVTGNIAVGGTVDGRELGNDGTALDAHLASTANPHQTTALQVDTQGGTNQLVGRINAGTGVIAEPRIDAQIARQSALNAHINSGTGAHAATAISAAAHNAIAATSVQGQLQEIVTDLASQAVPTGASTVGNDAFGTSPNNVAAGNVRTQLSSLLGLLVTHINNASGAHVASGVSVADGAGHLNAATVEAALAEILAAYQSDHYRQVDGANQGQHKAIHQPALPSVGGKALVLDSLGVGSVSNHFRFFADSSYLWITINAAWDGVTGVWARDSTIYPSTAIRLSRLDFALLYDNAGGTTFAGWEKMWRLPMSSTDNTAWELSGGPFQEVGYCGGYANNFDPAAVRTLWSGGAVTFRSRFPSTPSTITLTNSSWSGGLTTFGTLFVANRDGFGFRFAGNINPNAHMYWFGFYSAQS